MAIDKRVIEYLNKGLKMELTAVNQYMLHSRLAYDWGFDILGAKEYEESTEEWGHADQFIQRILFLDGHPDMQEIEKLSIGSNVREMLEGDLAGEHDSLAFYREAAQYCASVGDYGSLNIFSTLISDEEEHADWLQTQLDLMDQLGEGRYLSSLVSNMGADAGPSTAE